MVIVKFYHPKSIQIISKAWGFGVLGFWGFGVLLWMPQRSLVGDPFLSFPLIANCDFDSEDQ